MVNSTTGYVYLLHADGTNRFKIGYSINPINRQQTIEGQSPYPIKLITSYPTDTAYYDEKKLHKMFAHRRKHGEWFEFDSIDHAKGLIDEFFNIKSVFYQDEIDLKMEKSQSQYFPDYKKILNNIESAVARHFYEELTDLIVVKDDCAIIQINSNVNSIFELAEKYNNLLKRAFEKFFNCTIKIIYVKTIEIDNYANPKKSIIDIIKNKVL